VITQVCLFVMLVVFFSKITSPIVTKFVTDVLHLCQISLLSFERLMFKVQSSRSKLKA